MSQRINNNTLMQDPNEKVDYEVDWSDRLEGDTISGTPTWTVTPTGPNITTPAPSNTTTTTTVWMSAATADTDYRLEGTVTTTSGRILQRYLYILVRT